MTSDYDFGRFAAARKDVPNGRVLRTMSRGAGSLSHIESQRRSIPPEEDQHGRHPDKRLVMRAAGALNTRLGNRHRSTPAPGFPRNAHSAVVESSLEGELDDHLGYGKRDPVGRNSGNSRNGKRAKTLLTDAGPVQMKVPRVRAALPATAQPDSHRKCEIRVP